VGQSGFGEHLQYPTLKAIRWENRRIDLKGPAQVERGTMALHYNCSDGLTRYSIRFEPTRQKWYLEAIDDSGIMCEGRDMPPPRVFAPTNWSD
jgi:hypothetical protein